MSLTTFPSPQILQGPTKDDIDQQSVSSQEVGKTLGLPS